jgi:preprotein translocase subunit SecG
MTRLILTLIVIARAVTTGTGELPSVLRKCLEKQAKALMVAHGLAVLAPDIQDMFLIVSLLTCPFSSPMQSGKTGAIIASKKGAATLLQKSLAILGTSVVVCSLGLRMTPAHHIRSTLSLSLCVCL